ncbi:MAG TPA: hypothetical protein VI819_00350 [Patescibacteria group bacterium]|nr:hypothetical protein [Patescibacteria group bacterium]
MAIEKIEFENIEIFPDGRKVRFAYVDFIDRRELESQLANPGTSERIRQNCRFRLQNAGYLPGPNIKTLFTKP